MLANSRPALTFEHGIEQRELPGGRGLIRETAIASAIEVQILGLVADLGECGKARTDVEVHNG
jgi:hypothetical protein